MSIGARRDRRPFGSRRLSLVFRRKNDPRGQRFVSLAGFAGERERFWAVRDTPTLPAGRTPPGPNGAARYTRLIGRDARMFAARLCGCPAGLPCRRDVITIVTAGQLSKLVNSAPGLGGPAVGVQEVPAEAQPRVGSRLPNADDHRDDRHRVARRQTRTGQSTADGTPPQPPSGITLRSAGLTAMRRPLRAFRAMRSWKLLRCRTA